MASPATTIRPLLIAAHPHNNSLVVLVHGIMSGRYSAWAPAIDMIQEIHEQGTGASMASFDYYAFGYPSTWRQPKFEDLFDQLRTLLNQKRYDTVVLVGHSQGGILAKRFLIDELLNGHGAETKVDIVITLDTPHRGPRWWIYPIVIVGALWAWLPVLGRIPLLRQAADLGLFAGSLEVLREHWNSTMFPETPCQPEPHKRHIRSYTISGSVLPLFNCKVVVSEKSARGFEIDEPLEIPAKDRREWGIGHGVLAMMNYRHQIERLLSQHDSEGIVAARLWLKNTSSADLQTLVSETCHEAELPCEASAWLRRVQSGFQRRPLRKLSDAKVLAKFVELRLGHP